MNRTAPQTTVKRIREVSRTLAARLNELGIPAESNGQEFFWADGRRQLNRGRLWPYLGMAGVWRISLNRQAVSTPFRPLLKRLGLEPDAPQSMNSARFSFLLAELPDVLRYVAAWIASGEGIAAELQDVPNGFPSIALQDSYVWSTAGREANKAWHEAQRERQAIRRGAAR